MSIKKIVLNITLLVFTVISTNAQQFLDPEYIKVTNERAAKIVKELNLEDRGKAQTVTTIVAEQYRGLSKFHDEREVKLKALKTRNLSKEKEISKIDKINNKSQRKVLKLHESFLKKLGKLLTADEVDDIKDGMTYGVVPKTYAAFQDMLPNLTATQKKFIYDNLIEAREHAMDAGTSKEKHAWFGKYKGRINNYLSEQGYDLNKAGEEWQLRIKERNSN